MRLQPRRGASLPMVILFIAIMTIALTAAYTLNGAESQVGDDQEEQLEAFALAESGRHRFLIDRAALGWTTNPPAASEIDTIPYPGGFAVVSLIRIRPQVQQLPPLYLLQSRGVRTRGVLGNIPQAERTVAQYVYWDAAPINVLAGWTALGGMRKNGVNPGAISGIDGNTGAGGCPPGLAPVAAIAIPASPPSTVDPGNLAGTPLIKNLGDANSTLGSVDIDWAGIVNRTADIVYDIEIPGGVWPSFADPNYWPTIRINGNYTISTAGRGTLIVTGSLHMNSINARWEGVVLVGNALTSNGASGVSGATISGLNLLIGLPVIDSDIGNGNKAYHFNSCNAARALRTQAKLRPFPNTWMDNWASY